jgi:hypothetical protein
MDIGPDDRVSILGYASQLLSREDRRDPVKVAAAALPLLEYAEAAIGRSDLRARMRAMSRQHCNTMSLDGQPSPAQFVDQSDILRAFIVQGG